MEKPNGWDDAKAATGGDFEKPAAGGYVLGIVRIEEKPSDSGNKMITLYLDIAQGEWKNYHRELGEKLGKDCYLRYYQLTEAEKSIPFFKGMITSVEKSNPGYKWNWEPQTLRGKLVGANLREEEYTNKDGERRLGLKIAYLCSLESVPGLKVLPPKLLSASANTNAQSQSDIMPPQGDLPF